MKSNKTDFGLIGLIILFIFLIVALCFCANRGLTVEAVYTCSNFNSPQQPAWCEAMEVELGVDVLPTKGIRI